MKKNISIDTETRYDNVNKPVIRVDMTKMIKKDQMYFLKKLLKAATEAEKMKIRKQLELLKDAIIIYRLSRAVVIQV